MGWSTRLAVCGLALAALGCRAHRGAKPHISFPTTAAAGRPATCPDDAVDPGGIGPGPGPMDVRCSYEDTRGDLVQLRGQVLLEAEPGALPQPVPETTLTVSRADARAGETIGRATTDAQGSYSVSLVLQPGEYILRVAAKDTGEVLATRVINVPEGASSMAGLDLILRMDDRMRPQ